MTAKKRRKPRLELVNHQDKPKHLYTVQIMIWRETGRRILEDSWFETIEATSEAEATKSAMETGWCYIEELLPVGRAFGVQIGQITERNVYAKEEVGSRQRLTIPQPVAPRVGKTVAKLPVIGNTAYKPFSCPIIDLCTTSETLGLPRRSIRLD